MIFRRRLQAMSLREPRRRHWQYACCPEVECVWGAIICVQRSCPDGCMHLIAWAMQYGAVARSQCFPAMAQYLKA